MRLRDLPIRRKLSLVILAASGSALLLAALTLTTYEWFAARGALRNNLATLAEIVANNSTAALVFDDSAAGGEVLDSLRGHPDIVLARLYLPDGTPFAVYARGPAPDPVPLGDLAAAGGDTAAFELGDLVLVRSIFFQGEKVGTLYLRQSLEPLWKRLRRYVAIIGLGLLACLGIALGVSALLRNLVTAPIFDLVQTAQKVSQSRDYSLRARQHGRDELGVLIDAFNAMLEQIQDRDVALELARAGLEERVRERTIELESEIAQRSRIEAELRRFAADLERSNRDLQDFAYVASHDLQEPLRKIQAFGGRLERLAPEALGPKGVDYLRRMQQAATRMRTLIQELLTFSRVSTHAQPPQAVALGPLLAEVVGDLEFQVTSQGARIEIGELPSVDADPSQMRQLFQNLLSNALKFHRPDTAPEVRVFSEPGPGRPGMVKIAVADSGIGIEERHQERIFGVFQRLHARGKYEGTGMGLSICRKIVEGHGGTITVTSRVGGGSTFSVELHASGPESPGAAPSSRRQRGVA